MDLEKHDFNENNEEQSYRSEKYYNDEQEIKESPKKKQDVNVGAWILGALVAASLLYLLFAAKYPVSTFPEAYPVETVAPVVVTPEISEVQTTPVQNVNTTVEDIVEDTLPALVSIQATVSYTENYMFFGPQTVTGTSSGSGFIVKKDNTEVAILTNAHVIENATDLKITFDDESQYSAIIKSCDNKADLALLSVNVAEMAQETLDAIKCVTLGDSESLRLGQSVIAIGNALGYGQSVTTGIVSALNRTMTDEDGTEHTWIQTDAAINAGNSGGVLLDMNGRVIGINEAKIADTEVEGMGFAIPITYALSTIDELSAVEAKFPVEESKRGKLGVSCVEISEFDSALYNLPQGIMVKEVDKDKGADKAGMKQNDVIVKLNGVDTKTMNSFTSALSFYAIGDTVEVTVMRNSTGTWTEEVLTVTLTAPANE